MDQFLVLVDKLGFPAACLVMVVVALWIVIRWTGKNVVLPVTKSHIDLIGKAKETNETNANTLAKMADTSIVTGQAITRIADQHEESLKLTREIHAQFVRKTNAAIRTENELIRVENTANRAENEKNKGDQK